MWPGMFIKKAWRISCKRASDIYYGLSAREVWKFAFCYAVTLHIKVPEGWRDKKIADTEWFTKFLKRCESFFWQT